MLNHQSEAVRENLNFPKNAKLHFNWTYEFHDNNTKSNEETTVRIITKVEATCNFYLRKQ